MCSYFISNDLNVSMECYALGGTIVYNNGNLIKRTDKNLSEILGMVETYTLSFYWNFEGSGAVNIDRKDLDA